MNNVAFLLLTVLSYDHLKITQASKSVPHDVENEHGDPPFFFFWQNKIIIFLCGKFKKDLYVETFWARTSLNNSQRFSCSDGLKTVCFLSAFFAGFNPVLHIIIAVVHTVG